MIIIYPNKMVEEEEVPDSGQLYDMLVGGAGRTITIQSRDVTPSCANVSAETKKYIDRADTWTEFTMRFAKHEYMHFLRNTIIMAIDSQKDVKCLVPVKESINYIARAFSGTVMVHGHDLAIYDAIQLMPINQELPIGMTFELSIPEVKTPEALIVYSSMLKPSKKISIKPFNSMWPLMFMRQSESLSANFRVAVANNFSIRERMAWWLDGDDGLTVMLQLGRNPIAYLKTILSQLDESRLDDCIRASGYESDKIKPYILKSIGELL